MRIDIGIVEDIERKLGTLILIDQIMDEFLVTIKSMRDIDSEDIISWKTKINNDNGKYSDIIQMGSHSLEEAFQVISEETHKILNVLNKLGRSIIK